MDDSLPEDALAACRALAAVMARLHAAGEVWLPATAPTPPDMARTPAADIWGLALFAYLRLAGLRNGFPGLGPKAFGHALPPLRVYAPHLPPGVEPVLRRSLQIDPARRHPTPTALVEELARAFAAARRREEWQGQITLQVESATRAGLLHDLAGLPNQDSLAVLPAEGGLAVAVCDGVTHALIGSGELASQAAIASLSATLPPLPGLVSLEERAAGLMDAFEQAGRAILARSLALPLGRLAKDPGDLMCTTAVAAVIRGREMLLGNAGDSRAYLVRDGVAEQLTVDGDVRCVQLALGMPPEEAVCGPEAHALYHCLGVSRRTRSGPVHDEERARPSLTLLHLLPGDVVVLCTDGLVEEGVFLSSEELAALVELDTGPGLADALVEAACSLHRGPTEMDEGSGDDVTCVVVRVHSGEGATSSQKC